MAVPRQPWTVNGSNYLFEKTVNNCHKASNWHVIFCCILTFNQF